MKSTTRIPQKKILFLVLFTFILLYGTAAQAQIVFDDDVDDETPAAPIDGLLGLGLAAGVYYGIRKLRK